MSGGYTISGLGLGSYNTPMYDTQEAATNTSVGNVSTPNFRGMSGTSQQAQGTENSFEKRKATVKNNSSNILKWILGIGLAGVISVFALGTLKKKKVSFEDVQQALSEIFEKNLSKEETEKLIQKYTEIYTERENSNYFEKLITQLKQDYGVGQVKTTIEIDNTIQKGKLQTGAITSPTGYITVYPDAMKKFDDKDGFMIFFHEIKHVKQYADAYRADSKKLMEECVVASSKNNPDAEALIVEIMKEGLTREEAEKETYEILFKELKSEMEFAYKDLTPFEKNSAEYKRGLNYIEPLCKDDTNANSYNEEFKKYKDNICEKEAFKCGEMAKKLLDYIKQTI